MKAFCHGKTLSVERTPSMSRWLHRACTKPRFGMYHVIFISYDIHVLVDPILTCDGLATHPEMEEQTVYFLKNIYTPPLSRAAPFVSTQNNNPPSRWIFIFQNYAKLSDRSILRNYRKKRVKKNYLSFSGR